MKKNKKPKNYNGKGSIIDSRKDGRLEWRYRYNGKNKSIYAKSAKELDIKIQKYLREIDEEQECSYSKMILSEFVSMHVNLFKKQKLAKSTVDLYNDAIRLYLKQSSIDISLDKLTVFTIQTFIDDFKIKMSYESVKRLKGILNSAFEFGFTNGYIKKNLMKSIVMPAENNCNSERCRESKYLNSDETSQLYNLITKNCTDTLLTTVIVLLQYSGLRIGEALALNWSDVYIDDIENSYLDINKSIRRIKKPNGTIELIIEKIEPATAIVKGPTKTKKSTRILPIPNQVALLLLKYKDFQKTVIKNSYSIYEDNNIVFTTSTGKYIDAPNLQKRFKKFLKTNNFRTDISFHSLRHSYASLLYNGDVGLKMTSELLGHSSINITADLYTHVFDAKKFETVKTLNLL